MELRARPEEREMGMCRLLGIIMESMKLRDNEVLEWLAHRLARIPRMIQLPCNCTGLRWHGSFGIRHRGITSVSELRTDHDFKESLRPMNSRAMMSEIRLPTEMIRCFTRRIEQTEGSTTLANVLHLVGGMVSLLRYAALWEMFP